MAENAFDKKFGSEFVGQLSMGPGIYLFRNASDEVIYVGKAKNLRRRLQNYRNATRRRVHRKMRTLVREAFKVEVQSVVTEEDALLRENELILELKPQYNIDGAYAFLYPALGVGQADKLTLICITTAPDAYHNLDLAWYGTFRSRPRVKAAFEALLDLFSLIGHREKKSRLPPHPLKKGSRFVGYRQIPVELSEALPWFFAGEDSAFLGTLAGALLRKQRALRDAKLVQEKLEALQLFYECDAQRLRKALSQTGKPGSFIPQEQRDALFIRASFSED